MGFALAVAGAVVSLGLGSATAERAGASPPRTQLRSFVCQKALDPPARAVSIQAVMRPLSGTAKMQMRFDLMRRWTRHGPFRLVRGRLLGSWITPADPTLGQRSGDVWIVNHPVVNLGAPATYRFRVSFRWTDSRGQQLDSAVQSSPNCWQPELRADLLVRSVKVTPLAGGRAAYTAVVANRGRTGTGPVDVEFAGAGVHQTATIPAVGARSTARHRFVAPSCTAGDTLTVTVDPGHTIDEYNLADNGRTVPCPPPAGA